jgi:hypothetical protein
VAQPFRRWSTLVYTSEKKMLSSTRLKPLFHPGKLLVTPDALETLRASKKVPVISVVLRHIAGDWGCGSDDDARQNDLSIAAGLRLVSIYPSQDRASSARLTRRSASSIRRARRRLLAWAPPDRATILYEVSVFDSARMCRKVHPAALPVFLLFCRRRTQNGPTTAVAPSSI